MENWTLGQIAVGITTIGVIATFLFKIFTAFSRIKQNEKDIELLNKKIEKLQDQNQTQKEEILKKVEETNTAVNLLCSAISAMIDNELNDNKNKDELRNIKQKLDEKKEIV